MFEGRKVIALCMGRITNGGCQTFIKELAESLREQNCKLLIYGACTDMYWGKPSEDGEETVFSLIDYDIVDAMVLLDDSIKRSDVKERILDAAKAHNVPTLAVMRANEKEASVYFDDALGFESITKHVLEVHKPKTVHFMAGFRENEVSDRRRDAFCKAMRECGIQVDLEKDISYGDFWSTPTEAAVKKLIEEDRVPGAIICANDVMAITTCNVLRQAGIKVPEEVVVTGYDGIEDIYYSIPQITSCECDYAILADRVVELLLEVTDGKVLTESYKVAPKIHLSQSCGCGKGVFRSLAAERDKMRNKTYYVEEKGKQLADIVAFMQGLTEPEEIGKVLGEYPVDGVSIVLYESTLDTAIDPFEPMSVRLDAVKRILLCDSEDKTGKLPIAFAANERKNIYADKMQDPYPIMFFALYSQQTPLGYICTHFGSYEEINYSQIPQMVSYLSQASNSMRSLRYQKRLLKQIEMLYCYDGLTGLLSRNAFYKEYDAMVEAMGPDDRLSILMADLNDLKKINDVYGHNEGDHAIRIVADCIRNIMPENSLYCRYGGDELIAVTTKPIVEDELRRRCNEYLDNINKTSGRLYTISAGTGVVSVNAEEAKDFERVLVSVDSEMYLDKVQKKMKV